MTFILDILSVIGVISIIGVPSVAIIFWKKLMPKAARTIYWAKQRKQPPLLVVHDSGRGELTLVTERMGSGVVQTTQGKFKLLPRYISSINDDDEKLTDQQKETKQQKPKKWKSLIKDWSSWAVKRCLLTGLDLPFFVGYSGIVCLLSPEILALYEAGELKVKSTDTTLWKKVQGKSIKEALEPLMLLDPRVIKAIVSDSYDEVQIAAFGTEMEQIGLLGRGFRRYLPIMAIIVVAIIIIGVLYLLGSMGGA
jgi:hypothetical protein